MDGRVATDPLARVRDAAAVVLDGERVAQPAGPPRVPVWHQPRGTEVTLAGKLRERFAGLRPVGRLDKASSGVLLLTDRPDLAADWLRPGGGVEKLYEVRVRPPLDSEGHGERLRLQLLLNKQRYVSLAPLGCTNFGCTIVFNGDLVIFQCI